MDFTTDFSHTLHVCFAFFLLSVKKNNINCVQNRLFLRKTTLTVMFCDTQ